MATMNLTHSTGHGQGYGNQTLLNNPELCTLKTCDLSVSNFLYLPSIAGNAFYAAIFAIYAITQLYFGIKFKTWGYMVAMVMGLTLEVIGYVARVMIYKSPFDQDNFLMYLITLTMAPAWLTAAIYLCLSRIVIIYGENMSRFKPRTYTLMFCSCDLLSLMLQSVGGAIAATANTESSINLGKNIMLAGLVFQVFSLVLFAICAGEFALRVRNNKGQWNPQYLSLVSSKLFKSFLFGLAIASTTIFARCVYRCVELSGGFNGPLFVSNQAVFMVMEGVMIVIATTCLTLLHPAVCCQLAWQEANFSFQTKRVDGVDHINTVRSHEEAQDSKV